MEHIAIYAALALLLVGSLYRKGRRMIGERAFDRKKTMARLAVLAIAFALILVVDTQQVAAGLADPRAALLWALPLLGLGIGGGVALGVIAARMAQFRMDGAVLKVRAHALFGPAVLALYVLRVIYKFWLMQHLGLAAAMSTPGTSSAQAALAHYDVDPLGTVLRALFFAYYLSYYALLLRKAHAPLAMTQVGR